MKLFTPITREQLLNEDVVKIDYIKQRKSQAKSKYGQIEEYSEKTEHAIYRNGKFYSVIDEEELILGELVKQPIRIDICLHNYKFISKEDEWYIEGTEAYPDTDYDEDWSLFQGLTYKENFNEMEGTGPCWDGETCQFNEFIITERINQTRHRKLLRLLK